MKKTITLLTILLLVIFMVGCENSVNPIQPQTSNDNDGISLAKKDAEETNNGCVTIQSGLLYASDGNVITTGFDDWGYNYQGMLFNGMYCDAYRDATWCQEWKDVKLLMKWNEAWLSNKDCDDDGLLDRHFGYDSYQGSGAWCTNHQSGEYINDDGKVCKWNWFVKIVAVPTDAVLTDGVWYTADGIEIGPVEWGAFAVIQSVYNDPCGGYHGVEYLSPVRAGLGGW